MRDHMTEIKKYVLRFGTILLVVCPIIYWIGGAQALGIALHKLCLGMVGLAAAETIWAIFFKPVYGKTETLKDANLLLSVMLFRGMLYAALILGVTLGL